MHHYLIACYNNARFLSDTIASIRQQYASAGDFRCNARVFIVDDCSSDDTRMVLDGLDEQRPNIHVHFNPENQGIGRNRNFLLDWLYSTPVNDDDFVLFVDGDDILTPDHMACKLALFARQPELDVVGGQLELFYEDGAAHNVVDTFSCDPEVLAIAQMFECHIYVSNTLFRAGVFRPEHVRFPEVPASEDWLFFAQHPLKVRHVPQATLQYRRHSANITTAAGNAEERTELRHLAHRLGALNMGMHLSRRDCELLDLVGYLTFRTRWHGTQGLAANCHMPWFGYLAQRPDVRSQWPALRAELAALFSRMLEHNRHVRGYQGKKLAAFLAQILVRADSEAAGDT